VVTTPTENNQGGGGGAKDRRGNNPKLIQSVFFSSQNSRMSLILSFSFFQDKKNWTKYKKRVSIIIPHS